MKTVRKVVFYFLDTMYRAVPLYLFFAGGYTVAQKAWGQLMIWIALYIVYVVINAFVGYDDKIKDLTTK